MKNSLYVIFICVVSSAIAQKKIAVDNFTTEQTFRQQTVSGINWMNDGKFYSAIDDNKIVKYDITTGQQVETILDGSTLSPAITISEYELSADENKVLLITEIERIYRRSFVAEYFIYDLGTGTLARLSDRGKQSYATFSPDGRRVAFVRENNLFVVDLADRTESQVTSDGKFNFIINGTTDWVYEEEFGFVKGFSWSGDGRKLAYYRFDESRVREYHLQRWNDGALYPVDYTFKYPKAGETNSTVEIWIYDLQSGRKVKADIGTENDIYVPRISWTRDPELLSIRKMNRLQNRLEIIHTNAATGQSQVVLTETSDTYVDLESIDDLTYLEDGKHFIHASEKSGFKHVYLYTIDGRQVRQVTSGNYEVLRFMGVDEKNGALFYTSTEVSPLEKHLYSIALTGKRKTRLSGDAGTHSINMSDDFQFYIDSHSSAGKPLTMSLYRTKGNDRIKDLEKNETLASSMKEYGFVPKEFFTFKTVDGTTLNGYMLKPSDFDPGKKYPVLVYQYSGPGSQNVANAFGGSHFYFHQMIVQQGYIVVVFDSRGTGSRGEAFKKMTYKQMGKYELEDLIAAGRYLESLNYVDSERLGVWGWSYGGYMASLAMTKGSGTYKMGIAVAPVTNWRYYDTIYTERYLQTPQLNADGYDNNSPTTFAANMQGNFLLIHGTGDDNVHFQNSVALQDALIEAGKHFTSFYYPDKNHSIPGAKAKHHLYTLMAGYIAGNL